MPRHNVNKPAPPGYAQLASDHDSASEFEGSSSTPGPPIRGVRTSGRKRKQTDRFQAGPAKRKRPPSSDSSSTESSNSEGEPEEPDGEPDGGPEEPQSWVMQNLPTFAEKYPALHAQTTGPITTSLGAQIYELVKDQIVCLDHPSMTRAKDTARIYLAIISVMREENNLQPIPNAERIVEQVRAKWHGSYIASPMCPDDHYLLNCYKDIAEAMEVEPASPRQACQDIFQECYDTSKTEAFKRAVEEVVSDPQPLLYAIRMWQQHEGSDKIKNFIVKYAHALYNCRMRKMNLNIRF